MGEDNEFQDFRDMAVAAGFLVLIWSQIERQVDNWVHCAFHKCDGAKLTKNDAIPKMFTKKKEFLTKCFNELPSLADFKTEGLRLLDESFQISLKKNNFTHGTLDDMRPVKGVFHFRRIHHGKKNYTIEHFTFTPREEWPILEKSLLALLGDSSRLSDDLAKRFLPPKK